jgi:ribosomal protein S3
MAKRANIDDDDYGAKRPRTGEPTYRFIVGTNVAGIIIGKGGEKIKATKEEANVHISISKSEPHVQERIMSIRGDPTRIANAMQMITNQIIEGNGQEGKAGSTDCTLLMHKIHAGAVIGKQGATIKQIMGDTGASIRLSNDALPNTTEKSCTIAGDSLQIRDALEVILTKLEENPLRDNVESVPYLSVFARAPHNDPSNSPFQAAAYQGGSISGTQTEAELIIPSASAGMVIGKGGSTVASIKQQSSCIVSVGQSGDDTSKRPILIKGPSGGVQIALYLIRQLVEPEQHRGQSAEPAYISIPASKSGIVIGKGGQTIKEIKTQSGCHISLADPSAEDPENRLATIQGGFVGSQVAQFLIQLKLANPAPPSQQQYASAAPMAASPAAYGGYAAYGASQGMGSQGMGQGMGMGQESAYYAYQQQGSMGGSMGGMSSGMSSSPYGMSSASGGGESNKQISIPTRSAGSVIGKGGSTIAIIKQQSGCQISIAPASGEAPDSRVVTITGSPSGIQNATYLINQYASASL